MLRSEYYKDIMKLEPTQSRNLRIANINRKKSEEERKLPIQTHNHSRKTEMLTKLIVFYCLPSLSISLCRGRSNSLGQMHTVSRIHFLILYPWPTSELVVGNASYNLIINWTQEAEE